MILPFSLFSHPRVSKMKFSLNKYLLMSGVALSSLGFTGAAHAQAQSPWIVGGQLQGQYIFEDNRDLGTLTEDSADSFVADARARVTYRPTDTFLAYFEGLGVKTWGSASGEDETGISRPSGDYLEARQAFVKFSELGGVIPLDLQIGRQRIREDYSLWWNRDMDAVRVNYTTTLLKGFFAVAEELASYRTTNNHLDADLDNRLRVMFEASQVLTYGHELQFRALYEDDHSGTGNVGGQVDAFDTDPEDQKIFWGGLRSTGTTEIGAADDLFGTLHYRVDGIVAAGTEDMVTTAATANPDIRTVTAINDRDVLGWAVDAGADISINAPLNPKFIVGYAFGSGDDGSGTDTAFRQSDLQGNSSRLGLSTSSINNYGEALRPELSNLHVLTAGVGIPLLSASDVNFLYHYYMLDNEETGLRSSRVRAAVNGTDSNIGQGLDVVMNFDLGKEIPMLYSPKTDTDLRVSLGGFRAGDAYGDAEGEKMARALVQLRVKF